MSRRVVHRREVLAPALILVVVALAGLLIAGTRRVAVRTAAADAPNQLTLGTLRAGHPVCEGPLSSQGTARSVGIWGAAAGPNADLIVTVRDASTHRRIASGTLAALAREDEWTARLDRDVPSGRPVTICVAESSGAFSLSGSADADPRVASTGIGPGQRFSLVLIRDGSVLGSLSLAFSRAALWRFAWVGPWTFWILAIALLMTFGLAVVAVVRAAADDDEGPVPAPPEDPPLRDRPSEAREDRPQPVP